MELVCDVLLHRGVEYFVESLDIPTGVGNSGVSLRHRWMIFLNFKRLGHIFVGSPYALHRAHGVVLEKGYELFPQTFSFFP
jgi:hypothetical protein